MIDDANVRDQREQQAPAVDRDALAEALFFAYQHSQMWQAEEKADALIASGVLQDAAEVEARGLVAVRDEIRGLACWRDPATGQSGFNLGNDEDGEAGARMAVLDILDTAIARAQQVREGTA